MRVCEGCGVEFEGSPQARFHSDACRKRTARRTADEAGMVSASAIVAPAPPAVLDVVDEAPLPALPTGRPAPPLEAYVAEMVEAARLDALANRRRRPDIYDVADRVRRAEKYARWRHAGYVRGEVASL